MGRAGCGTLFFLTLRRRSSVDRVCCVTESCPSKCSTAAASRTLPGARLTLYRRVQATHQFICDPVHDSANERFIRHHLRHRVAHALSDLVTHSRQEVRAEDLRR